MTPAEKLRLAAAISKARREHGQGDAGELAVNCVVEQINAEIAKWEPGWDSKGFREAAGQPS